MPEAPPLHHRSLGEFLRHRRKLLNDISQADLCALIAEETGLRQPHYSAIEANQRTPNQLQAAALARELRLDPIARKVFMGLIVALQKKHLHQHRAARAA